MKWREKIELNATIAELNEEFDLSEVEKRVPRKVAKVLAAEVSRSNMLICYAERILKAKSLAELNRILENVFDSADKWSVWCGMSFRDVKTNG